MTSWRYSTAALTFFVGACDIYLNVNIQTPKVEIVTTDDSIGGEHSRTLLLPICDLTRCVSGDCSKSIADQLQQSASDTWKLFERKPNRVNEFTENGYSVVVSTSASNDTISENWADVACVRGSLDADDPSASRTRQCFRHMSKWTAASITGSVERLSFEPKFRSTCLRSS